MRNRAENQVILALIRHGETKANQEHRYLGQTDEPLSEDGIKKLMAYKKRNLYPDVQYLFTSPMRRCLETAEILYPNLRPVVISEWSEMDFGRFEYKNYEELKHDTDYQAWIDSGGTLSFPGGESRAEFVRRCESGFMRMCGKMIKEIRAVDGKVGLIVHGGTIMALLSRYGEKDYFDYQASNGRGYLCRMEDLKNQIRLTEVEEI